MIYQKIKTPEVIKEVLKNNTELILDNIKGVNQRGSEYE
jgi:hypothetical protein